MTPDEAAAARRDKEESDTAFWCSMTGIGLDRLRTMTVAEFARWVPVGTPFEGIEIPLYVMRVLAREEVGR